MVDIAEKARQIGREDGATTGEDEEVMNIIEFIESPHGLRFAKEICGQELFPVQRFILKAYYHLPLDDEDPYINIPKSWRHAQEDPDSPNVYNFTEVEYMEYLNDNGRCNIPEQDHRRQELVLPIGRRSGKSTISAMIAAYETYKLIKKGNPQAYYGVPEGNRIQICSVATSTDQAGILYQEVKRHYNNCRFFDQFKSKNTQKYVQFQTPHDISTTGKATNVGSANESIRVTFYSSVAKGIRGSANLVVIMDEVAFFSSSGQTSAEEVYKAVSPSVASFSPKDPKDASIPIGDSEGRIILISSPGAKEGLFYEKYAAAKSGGPESKDVLMIQAPTWEVNPTIPKDYFEKEHAKDAATFACEFGAQFTDQIKTWIERPHELMACVDPSHKPSQKGKPRAPHYLGLDVGVIGDRTAVAITRPTSGGIIELVYHELWQAGTDWYEINPHLKKPLVPYCKYMESEERLDFDEIANWLGELSNRFYIVDGVFDQFEAISLEQTLHKMDLTQFKMKRFRPRETSDQFQAFKDLMWHEKLRLYDYLERKTDADKARGNSMYIQELLELQAEARGNSMKRVEAPQVRGKYDDFADALVRSTWLSMEQVINSNGGFDDSYVSRDNGVGARDQGGPSSYRQYQRVRQKRRNYVSKRDPNTGRN